MKKALIMIPVIMFVNVVVFSNLVYALNVLSFPGDLSKFGSFFDKNSDKKTRISYTKSVDEKKGSVLKVKYYLDKDSWCGILRHSVNQKWHGAKAMKILIRGTQDSIIRVSFLDANRVSYINDIEISSEWKIIPISIKDFKKNSYYQPPEAQKDKPLNFSKIHQLQFEPQTEGNGIFYLKFVNVEGVIEELNKLNNGIGKKSTAGLKRYETFEKGRLINDFKYANKEGGAKIEVVVKKREKSHGKKKNRYYLKSVYTPGTGDYGCGFGFASSRGNTTSPFSAKGRVVLQAIVKAPKEAKFRMSITEWEDNDDEKWNSSWQTGTGRWKKHSLSLNLFEKSSYVGNQEGNNKLDIENIKNVEVEIAPDQNGGVLMLDDLLFK